MRRLVVVVALLAACSSSPSTRRASSTTEPTAPSSTLPAGVGSLCDRATLNVAQEAFTYSADGKVPSAAYGKSRFADALHLSLNDCSTRIEWVTAMEAHLTEPREGPLDAMFGLGCDKERLGQEIDRGLGVTPEPLPPACG